MPWRDCTAKLKYGDGFCEMFFSDDSETEDSRGTQLHGVPTYWYNRIRSVRVPAGCWLRVYVSYGPDMHNNALERRYMGATRAYSDILTDVREPDHMSDILHLAY